MHTLTDDERHYEKYIHAGLDLLTTPSGPAPSARALVERLGGSLTTANKAMKVFWQFVARQMAYQKQYPDGTPNELIQLLETMMAKARTQAQDELTQERARITQEEEQMQSRIRFLTVKNEGLKRQVDQYYGELREAEKIETNLTEGLERLRTTLTQERRAQQTLEQQLTQAQTQVEQLQSLNQKLQQDLTQAKENLQAKDQKIESIQEQHHSTLRANDGLERELATTKEQYNAEVGTRQGLEQRSQHQKAQLTQHVSAIENLERHKQELQNNVDTTQNRNAELTAALQAQKAETTAIEQQQRNLEFRLHTQEHLQRQIKTLEADKQQLMKILESFNEKLQANQDQDQDE